MLNHRALIYIGVLSYSLYLWQQPFFYSQSDRWPFRFPWNLLIAFALANLSHTLVERPFLKLRKRFDPKKRGPFPAEALDRDPLTHDIAPADAAAPEKRTAPASS